MRGLVGIVRASEYLLHGVQVLANLHVNRDAHTGRSLKGLAEAWEDETLKGRRKGAELDPAKLVTLRMPALEFLDQDIAHTDAYARVVVAHPARRLDAVAQHLHLVRHGHVAQHQHLAGDQHVTHPLQCPADRRVVGAAKVDAQAQVQLASQVNGRVAGDRGAGGLRRGDQVVGQQHVGGIQEFAHVLLRPADGVVQGFS